MIVFDASTLILLAKATILRSIIEHIAAVIPPIVRRECIREQEREDAKLIGHLIDEGVIRVQEPEHPRDIERLQRDFDLDRGEATALVLALERRLPLATDDTPARKACIILKVPHTGAVALLVALAEHKVISAELALEKLKKLKQYGRYKAEILENARVRIKKAGD